MFDLANGKMEMHACVSLDQDFRPILLPAFKDFSLPCLFVIYLGFCCFVEVSFLSNFVSLGTGVLGGQKQ